MRNAPPIEAGSAQRQAGLDLGAGGRQLPDGL